MAVITIRSDPASISTSVLWRKLSDVRAVPVMTAQIVTFDLTSLGRAPVIVSAMLTATTTHDTERDEFLCEAGRVTRQFRVNSSADFTTAVQAASGSIDITTRFMGYIPMPQEILQNSTVSYTLTVTTEGEAEVDKRSDGTLTVASVEFGGTSGFTVEPFSAGFSHAVTWKIASYQHTKNLNAGETSTSFVIPTAWMNAVPNSVRGSAQVILDTLEDGVSVGTREYSLTLTVPSAVKPSAGTLTASAVNSGALAEDTRLFVGASRASLSLTGSVPGTGSRIASVTFSGWGGSLTTEELSCQTSVLQVGGTVRMTALVTDSRGRTDQTTVDVQVYEYAPPYFDTISWIRCKADGTPDESGAALMINAVFGCSTEVFEHNTATATVAIRERGADTWSAETQLTNGTDTLVTAVQLLTTVGYEMRFTVSDQAMSVETYAVIPSHQFILHFSNNGRSIGIGQAAQDNIGAEYGRLAVNPEWSLYFGEDIHIGSQTLAEYIRGIVAAAQGS